MREPLDMLASTEEALAVSSAGSRENEQSMVHLTEKPVELAVRAIQYGSRSSENVLDLFGGSGSTLIAAQQTGRRAYLMEGFLFAGSAEERRKDANENNYLVCHPNARRSSMPPRAANSTISNVA